MNVADTLAEDLTIQAFSNGSIVIRGTGPVGIKDLRQIIENKLIANPKLVVVIETHPDAEYAVMIDILDELRLAKAERISLRTMKSS